MKTKLRMIRVVFHRLNKADGAVSFLRFSNQAKRGTERPWPPQHIARANACTANITTRSATTHARGGILHTEILLPAHAPACFRDRATLWNAVEAAERYPKAQLAYSFDIALQNELSLNENIELARAFRAKRICGSRNDRRPCHSFSRQDRRHSQSPHARHDHHASIES